MYTRWWRSRIAGAASPAANSPAALYSRPRRTRPRSQWSPSHNQNSAQHQVKAGDLLYGSITLDPKTKSYNIYHNVSGSTTWDVTMNIPIQKGKTYTIAYVVYEKVAPCGDYPPDGSVTFSKINVYCDNKPVTPAWTTGFVEDVCNNRATVVDANTIKIAWNTKAQDPSPELIAASQSKPFKGAAAQAAAKGLLRGEAA